LEHVKTQFNIEKTLQEESHRTTILKLNEKRD
jgi:hypothetical protein